MNDTKLANKSVTFAAHTTIYEKKVRETERRESSSTLFFAISQISGELDN